jgi:hypothetical protein
MRNVIIVVLAAVSLLGCRKESPTAPGVQGLPGSWRATRAEFVSRANPSVRVEIIARGSTMTLLLNEAKTFTLTINTPGEAPKVEQGTWNNSVDILTLKRTGQSGESQFDYTLSGDTLMLAGGSALFAFDTVLEEAILNATFARQ